jgi:hypothetical protein
MRIVSRLALAALAGLFASSFASQARAQDSARDAAIHKCILEAQQRHPDIDNPGNQRNRTLAYKSCMAAMGLAP